MKTSVVFFGTHEFAATILEGLLDSDSISVDLVITQPDRAVGRKQTLEESAVKKLAKTHGIKIEQPESLKDYSLLPTDYSLNIVAQYGLIIPKRILDTPQHGSINVHGSLLPKYRGASPIQTAIIKGEKETGVTIMLMDEKMDHGPILSQESLPIDEDDTSTTLGKKMAQIGSKLLLNTIPGYISGQIIARPQDGEPTFTKLLSREDGKIDFNKTADEIYNLYRGLTPWPGVWAVWNGKRLKLHNIKKSKLSVAPGLVNVENQKLFIGTSNGSIEVLEIQLEGKPPMNVSVFLNGYKNIANAKF